MYGYNHNQMSKHKYGNAGVQYGPDGRLMMGGGRDGTFPRVHDRRGGYDDDFRSYDAHREKRRQAHDRRGGYDDRGYDDRYDDRRRRDDYDRRGYGGYDDRYTTKTIEHKPQPWNSAKRDWKDPPGRDYGYDRSGVMGNKNYYYDQRSEYTSKSSYGGFDDSPFGIVFVINGSLLLLCALINVLICTDYHYYCGFWAGVIVIEFGVFGIIHRGDYRTKWKNYGYMAFGLLTTVVVFAGSAMVFEKVIRDFITLTLVDDTDEYIALYANDEPHTGDDIDTETRIWVCLGMDCTMIVFFIFDYLALLAVMFAGNQYWELNCEVKRNVQPWCRPVWFNPFGLLPMGEAIAFMGLLVRYGCFSGPDDTDYYKWWGPVWAGGLVCLGGMFAAAAYKRPDNVSWNVWAGLMNLLATAGCIAAMVFCILGLVDNADILVDDKDTAWAGGPLDDNSEDRLIGSAVLYGLTAGILVGGALYCTVVMFHLFMAAYAAGGHYYRRDNRSYTSSDSGSYYDRDRRYNHDKHRKKKAGPGTGFDDVPRHGGYDRGGYDRDGYDRRGYQDSYFGNRDRRY